LILDLAGGELADGVLDAGTAPAERGPITLRFSQLKRVLGIDIPPAEARRILSALGCSESQGESAAKSQSDPTSVTVTAPSWRSDLTREIDLVEEVARIHGYDQIPEDVRVPMATSQRTREDRVLTKVRHALTAAGYDEALTLSAVDESLASAFSPWTSHASLSVSTPVLRRANRLRLSLIPSLLSVRQVNEALSNPVIELFEIAKIYLPSDKPGQLPTEETMIGLVSGSDYFAVKAAIEALVSLVNPQAELTVARAGQPLLDAPRSSVLSLKCGTASEQVLAYLGEVSASGRKQFDLRGPATIAEIRLSVLLGIAELIPQAKGLSPFPAVTRDLNLVVDEATQWADVARTVRESSGPHAEHLELQDVYRDAQRLGAGKKSLLLTLTLRSSEGTLTREEADAIREQIVAACAARHGAQLRAG
jgi:phenylalanyl-tRNA synthetase beta chain